MQYCMPLTQRDQNRRRGETSLAMAAPAREPPLPRKTERTSAAEGGRSVRNGDRHLTIELHFALVPCRIPLGRLPPFSQMASEQVRVLSITMEMGRQRLE
jgi:hypothetical protein